MHLCDFISFPGAIIQYYIKKLEEVMGTIQITTREQSERDALLAEIEAHRSNEIGGLKYHTCDIEGHTHTPLPMVKGSYGK